MDTHDLAFQSFHCVEMMFLPDAWADANNSNHEWTSLDFPPPRRRDIPHQPGVYIFVVQPELFAFDKSSGLFYIGKATDLYSRVGAYMHELRIEFSESERPHVWRMLNQWNGYLDYYYTTTDTVQEAEELEDEMLKAFRPHFNRQFPAEISAIMRAF